MEKINVIQEFLRIRCSGYGYGSGYGSGYGNGDGSGYGNGDGSGYGNGSGYGYGYGSGYGYGNGDGNGYGNGSGYGYGYGNGDGNCDGSGYGYGSGYGNGYGYGLKEYCGETVWYIDDVPTLIDHIRGDYARGRIVNSDLTTTPCYIARVENSFAHGETLKAAVEDAEAKAMEEIPLKKRLSMFKTKFPSLQDTATCADFYKWHHILTGSCRMGRDQFVSSHSLNMEKEYTVEYFLLITKDSYGGAVIRQLRETYQDEQKTTQ